MSSTRCLGAFASLSPYFWPAGRLRGRNLSAAPSNASTDRVGDPAPPSAVVPAIDEVEQVTRACATSIAVAPPQTRRPQSSTGRRLRAARVSPPSSASGTPSVSSADMSVDTEHARMGKREIAEAATEHGWHLVWSCENSLGMTPESPPMGSEAVLVVHRRDRKALTTDIVQSLSQPGGLGIPVFVLLYDMCGAAHSDLQLATALQKEFIREGAEDVLCNARTVEELQLAMAMAMHRHAMKLETMSRMRARFMADIEQCVAKILQGWEEAHGTGLFWQSVDRLFKDFPAMDLLLPKEFEPGTRVGSRNLVSALGQGSYGKVYGAVDEQSGASEAMKAIAKKSLKEIHSVSALCREIRMHSRLENRHIVRFLGVVHGPMHVVIRMEAASEASLRSMMRAAGGPLPLADTRRFLGQLSGAVAYCHAQGVAHRDLKPENIGLEPLGGDIKVLDFGCSVRAGSMRTDVAGSLPLMAPEIIVASVTRPYEAAGVDIWACGVILMELLLGVHGFSRLLGWSGTPPLSPKTHRELVRHFSDTSSIVRHCGDAGDEGLRRAAAGDARRRPRTSVGRQAHRREHMGELVLREGGQSAEASPRGQGP